MKGITTAGRKLAVGAAAALVGGVAAAWASSAGVGPGAATGSGASATARLEATASPPGGAASARATGSLLARADHGSLEVRVKGQWVTFTLDAGKVTSVSGSSITLARPDGQNVTEAITSGTRFKGVTSPTAIVVGKRARVISQNGVAVQVAQRSGNASPSPATTGPAGTAPAATSPTS
jgi:hypothetical protein